MEFEDTKECRYCHRPLVKMPDCFALREVGVMPGMVCQPCNVLYESKEWLEALQKRIDSQKYDEMSYSEDDLMQCSL